MRLLPWSPRSTQAPSPSVCQHRKDLGPEPPPSPSGIQTHGHGQVSGSASWLAAPELDTRSSVAVSAEVDQLSFYPFRKQRRLLPIDKLPIGHRGYPVSPSRRHG